jgi:sugar phosphate isomerase/epimerase
MKLAVAVASRDAPDDAFVVWRGFEESFRKAKEYGYHGVELALKSADDVNVGNLERWLSKYDLEVSCISTGQVFAVLDLYFTHPDADRRRELISVFTGLIRLARDFGRMVNVGRARGFFSPKQSRDEVESLFIETTERLCEVAEPEGVTIIIEPVNRYEINFVNSVEDGAEILSRIKSRNVGLMPDVFHMNIEDAHIGESLARYGQFVKYIHFADSNRWAPGQGHLDFDEVFDGLKRGHFDGWGSIEIIPKPDPDTAARQAAETILPMIARYNAQRDTTSRGGAIDRDVNTE